MAKSKEPEKVVEETSEQSRRDFITKMVTAAGAVAAAGLVAGAQSADAELGKIEYHKIEDLKNVTQIKWDKVRNGFRLTLSGRELGTALQGAGVLAQGVNLDNATLTIEFSA